MLSYLRRRKTPARRTPIAEDEAINLETIGGEINNSYVDIASVSSPATKGAQASSGRSRAAGAASRTNKSIATGSTIAAGPPNRAPAPEREPSAVRTVRPSPPPRPARPVPRPRRRSDGNGAVAGDRKGVLSVHGIEKSFVGRMVVKGVSLYVRQGEAVGLLGPNGAGKTTVFYMITGLIKADKGRIELDGHDVTKLPMYQRARLGIGYLPQEASIFRGLNVEDNIRAVLEVIEPECQAARAGSQCAA